ncbi:Alpha crystallin/Hsp20 domain [Fusarium oxysporum f. sp. vasinfectum]|nr:Alpha crystallin/Hsp20 domain [Fusarium oxysporum f. sp. vasinfectum]KAK2937628.1 Alpha crystallin/Hsp20 domain [Fusarium oxysporum f. sp. vasinfectum]
MSRQPNPFNNANFWDFVQHFDPNQATGRGVDHQTETPFPSFMAGFPFGSPAGPHPPHYPHPHGHGHGPRGPPPPPEADGFVWGPWFSGEGAPDSRIRNEQRQQANETQQATSSESHESDETMNVPDPEEAVAVAVEALDAVEVEAAVASPTVLITALILPPPPYGGPFDLSGLFRGWGNHPFFRNMREQFQENQNQEQDTNDSSDSSFNPPIDIFNTEKSYVIHVALPGAKKEDIGVNWDADRNLLKIAGVVHRPGDEAFLSTLSSGERKVGMFERNVALPPTGADERDEVDGLGITAKMEDGVLAITVPKAEKEWTEIHKIDIE